MHVGHHSSTWVREASLIGSGEVFTHVGYGDHSCAEVGGNAETCPYT